MKNSFTEENYLKAIYKLQEKLESEVSTNEIAEAVNTRAASVTDMLRKLAEKKLINYWLFWGVIVALLIFHGLTYMEPRYMFPARVALYIMSAAGLYRLPWIQRKVNYIAKFVFTTKSVR